MARRFSRSESGTLGCLRQRQRARLQQILDDGDPFADQPLDRTRQREYRSRNTCHRPFIFFAKEQRYWFETLRFLVDADCVHCPDCRRESRTVQRRLRRYSDLFAKNEPTRKELMFLVDDGLPARPWRT